MDIQKIISIILLAISTLAILAALIFDMNGRLITHFENPFRKAKSINVSNLATGAYILNLDGQNFKFLKK